MPLIEGDVIPIPPLDYLTVDYLGLPGLAVDEVILFWLMDKNVAEFISRAVQGNLNLEDV